jgi:hypothetical protein
MTKINLETIRGLLDNPLEYDTARVQNVPHEEVRTLVKNRPTIGTIDVSRLPDVCQDAELFHKDLYICQRERFCQYKKPYESKVFCGVELKRYEDKPNESS